MDANNKELLIEIKKEIEKAKLEVLGDCKIKAEKYEELSKELKNVKFGIKDVFSKYDEFGNPKVIVRYEAVAMIEFDSNGEPIYPENLKSINKLDLIPYDDMRKVISTVARSKLSNK